MDQWKNFEADTIKLYEEVGLFHPNTIGPGPDKFGNDLTSLVNKGYYIEHKQCFSRYHSDELYDQFGEIILSRRLAVQQGQEEDGTPKVRGCDDATASLLNPTYSVSERLHIGQCDGVRDSTRLCVESMA